VALRPAGANAFYRVANDPIGKLCDDAASAAGHLHRLITPPYRDRSQPSMLPCGVPCSTALSVLAPGGTSPRSLDVHQFTQSVHVASIRWALTGRSNE
jgi:hypothetical protein